MVLVEVVVVVASIVVCVVVVVVLAGVVCVLSTAAECYRDLNRRPCLRLSAWGTLLRTRGSQSPMPQIYLKSIKSLAEV